MHYKLTIETRLRQHDDISPRPNALSPPAVSPLNGVNNLTPPPPVDHSATSSAAPQLSPAQRHTSASSHACPASAPTTPGTSSSSSSWVQVTSLFSRRIARRKHVRQHRMQSSLAHEGAELLCTSSWVDWRCKMHSHVHRLTHVGGRDRQWICCCRQKRMRGIRPLRRRQASHPPHCRLPRKSGQAHLVKGKL